MRIHVLGRVGVVGRDGAFDQRDLPGLQGLLLLGHLVVERRQVSRDALADLLWNGAPPAGWVSGLNALISKLRGLLDGVGVGRGALVASSGAVELVLPSATWVDLEWATTALDRADGAWRRGDLEAALGDATAASAVFRRPFLVGVDHVWVDAVRRRSAAQAYRCTELLASAWLRRGDFELAANVAESAIVLDPLRECGYRLAIEARVAQGDRALAVRTFERCERVLRDELGVEPSAQTRAVLD